MKMRLPLTLTALAIAVPVATIAHSNANVTDNTVKARHGYFQLVRHNAGMLFGMAKGDIPYDAATATAHARNLEAIANLDTATLWAQGTDNASLPGQTRALPSLWTTFPAVMTEHQAFQQAAANMAANAGNGLDALRANAGPLGASCKGCHDKYRAKSF